jgi:hypothetical protein
MSHWLKRFYIWVRFGKITKRVTATAGDNVPAEIEYLDRRGRVVGFWAYGDWHPRYPYRGEPRMMPKWRPWM